MLLQYSDRLSDYNRQRVSCDPLWGAAHALARNRRRTAPYGRTRQRNDPAPGRAAGAYVRAFAQLATGKWITAFEATGAVWEWVAFVHADGPYAALIRPFGPLPPGQPRELWFGFTEIDRLLHNSIRTVVGAAELARLGLAIAACDGDRVLLRVTDVRAAWYVNEARVRGQLGRCKVSLLVGAFLKRGDPRRKWIRVSEALRLSVPATRRRDRSAPRIAASLIGGRRPAISRRVPRDNRKRGKNAPPHRTAHGATFGNICGMDSKKPRPEAGNGV